MFRRITRKTQLNLSFSINKPSRLTVNAIISVIQSVKEFDWLNIEMKVTEFKGYNQIRSTAVNLSDKEEILKVLQTYDEDTLPSLREERV